MIFTSEMNYAYSWQYGDEEINGRQDSRLLPFKTFHGKLDRPLMSFKEELEYAAKSTIDHYPNLKPCLFFSGGVDSEMMLRSYLNIGVKPEIYIARFEKDYNLYDVSYAIAICSSMGLEYNLIDFSLEKFYENDAETVAEQAQIDRPRMLPHLKLTDAADGLIIVGHADVRYFRTDNDYSKKGTWLAQDFEHDIGCDKYNIMHNRPAIFQWWRWTPGLVLSYTKMNWFQKLVNDEYPGKMGIDSSKIIGYKESYPDLLHRKKNTGLDKIDHIVEEFQSHLQKKFGGLIYRQEVIRTLDELEEEILA